MVKKTALLLIAVAVAFSAFACAPGRQNDDGKLRVVTTIFPIYDWVRSILGDDPANAEVVLLEDSGVDLHSFQPTVDDVAAIASCDVFIYVGGESDGWVPKALQGLKNSGRTDISLLDALGESALHEERVEGMQQESGEEDGGNEGPGSDEHVWLSLRNAAYFCEYISEVICAKDPSNREAYERNTETYVGELKALDGEFAGAAEKIDRKVLLFADRFPFRYFTEDYGFEYYAAFPGCSAETEASFATIVFLADKINELSLDVIFCTEGSDEALARTVRDTAKRNDLKICRLNSLQSVSAVSVREGATYLGLMRENLESLNEAFNVH
ncbi:MAG: zinc ABC transporter substrate-binding protein [Clostridia bacterium]|nr:zinc ABC transporter substrate-binding protein [Clostridia bacterium]